MYNLLPSDDRAQYAAVSSQCCMLEALLDKLAATRHEVHA